MKKLLLTLIVLVISLSLVGCQITDAHILAKAAEATWQTSADGFTYLGYIQYANEYWYYSHNIMTGSVNFGYWNKSQFWSHVNLMLQGGWDLTSWSSIPDAVKLALVEVVREVMPLSPIWSNFFIIFPVCLDDSCAPALMPTPQAT